MAGKSNCEMCLNYEYDEEVDCFRCSVELDEDEACDFMLKKTSACPFYNPGDEYSIVRKQN